METREKQAEILKFMGTSTRLDILQLMLFRLQEEGIQPVEISRKLKLDSVVVSRELRILKQAGIIDKVSTDKERNGVGVFYRLESKLAIQVMKLIVGVI